MEEGTAYAQNTHISEKCPAVTKSIIRKWKYLQLLPRLEVHDLSGLLLLYRELAFLGVPIADGQNTLLVVHIGHFLPRYVASHLNAIFPLRIGVHTKVGLQGCKKVIERH
jgi:hypothetical protein